MKEFLIYLAAGFVLILIYVDPILSWCNNTTTILGDVYRYLRKRLR